MNEQRAASTATMTTSSTPPLRDSPGNAFSNHVRHWSQPSTTPLRLAKHDPLLTPNSISNTRHQKLPTQLARRQSSSYNHVKNNSLVSKSPFKVSATAKASRIPTPSRPEDENQPDLGSYRRRQSKGLHVLAKEQVVTKSPFLSDKNKPESKTERPERGRSLTPTQPLDPQSQIVSTMSSMSPTQPMNAEPEATYVSNIPAPTTPRNSRMISATDASSSPKSVLVSPKRLHGPRSLSASPGAELKAQRRKTVTFVELIDVLEFDKEDVSDVAYSADEYGSPEPQSPVATFNEDSFDSSIEQVEILSPSEESPVIDSYPIQRTPHISRVDVRRRIMEQQPEDESENENSDSQILPDAFTDIPLQNSQITRTSIGSPSVFMDCPLKSPTPDDTADTSVNLNTVSDIQSALDSLMLGVEKELMATHRDNLTPELSEDLGENVRDRPILLDSSFDGSVSINNGAEDSTVSVCVEDSRSQHLEVSPESGSTDDDNDEPGTPREQNSQLPYLSMESIRIDNDDSLLTLDEKASHPFINKSEEIDLQESSMIDLSGCELHLTSTELETSSPPRKEPTPYNATASSSLALPPLSFDNPLESTSSWSISLDISPPQSSQRILNDTFYNPSPPMPPVRTAPPVPPKDDSAIRRREELIKARRRELQHANPRPLTYHEGRPSRRRSLSTGDAEDLVSVDPASQRRAENLRDGHDISHLDIPIEQKESDSALSEVIDQELKLRRKPTVKEQQARQKLFKIREREDVIYASGEDKVSHSRQAGDVDVGKAWKTIRRPSDMNEHSQLIKQYQALQKPGKAYGKVFVRVLGIRKLNIPMPSQPTPFTCTLNNGIHFVTTPECRLGRDARIEQEFELIEHSKLEFKLTLKVSRTPEIAAQDKINVAPPPMSIPVPPPPPPVSSSRGVRSFFGVGGSPKKHHNKITVVAASPTTAEPVVENNFARYLKPNGTLAQTLVSFKEIASRCDTRIFETSFPLIGQRTTGSGKTANVSPQTIGEIVLKIFRLPPLPGIPNDQLPQSLDECHRGLQYTSWHKVTYHEGILTQNGGDCRTWRRRLLRVIGSNLVAFNDVTKKATATVDLKKAIAVEDDDITLLPKIASASRRARDEFDEAYKVERSFRLVFPDEEITFFADTEEAKQTWLKVLGALVGHIPPNPLWAELAWQRQEDLRRQEAISNCNFPE